MSELVVSQREQNVVRRFKARINPFTRGELEPAFEFFREARAQLGDPDLTDAQIVAYVRANQSEDSALAAAYLAAAIARSAEVGVVDVSTDDDEVAE